MRETTWFRIDGRDLPARATLNVKGSRKWIDQVGKNVRLADGTRETLRRPQFLKKHAVTISGEGSIPLPVSDLVYGDEITIDFPHLDSVPGEVAAQDLDFPPAADRIWYFGDDAKLRDPGDPDIVRTIWVPRMTIMLDAFNSDFDDAKSLHSWTIEAEIV